MLRSLTIVFLLFLSFALWTVYSPEELAGPVDVTIKKGETVDTIIETLTEKGLVDSALLAKLYVRVKGTASRLQAGDYTFENKISLASVLNRLSSPDNGQQDVLLTFIEGWTIEEMSDYAASVNELNISREEFIEATQKRYSVSFIAIIPRERDLEGYLFPDTYRVFKDSTAEDIVEKMLINFETKLNSEALSEIDRQGRELDDVIILASILERELRELSERKNGADVFLKRLQGGIPLQADSTVNYITKKKTPRASAEDLKIDSPYNTYKYRGLPPGPISNPGETSLQAAIYPTSNPYYYFLTTPEGEAIFNITLDAHNEDKRRYY